MASTVSTKRKYTLAYAETKHIYLERGVSTLALKSKDADSQDWYISFFVIRDLSFIIGGGDGSKMGVSTKNLWSLRDRSLFMTGGGTGFK